MRDCRRKNTPATHSKARLRRRSLRHMQGIRMQPAQRESHIFENQVSICTRAQKFLELPLHLSPHGAEWQPACAASNALGKLLTTVSPSSRSSPLKLHASKEKRRERLAALASKTGNDPACDCMRPPFTPSVPNARGSTASAACTTAGWCRDIPSKHSGTRDGCTPDSSAPDSHASGPRGNRRAS